jgi:hypothetical protein
MRKQPGAEANDGPEGLTQQIAHTVVFTKGFLRKHSRCCGATDGFKPRPRPARTVEHHHPDRDKDRDNDRHQRGGVLQDAGKLRGHGASSESEILADAALKRAAAVLVVLEHVEAGAGRREQDDVVPKLARLRGDADGFLHRLCLAGWNERCPRPS